jgi:hypothetical protein
LSMPGASFAKSSDHRTSIRPTMAGTPLALPLAARDAAFVVPERVHARRPARFSTPLIVNDGGAILDDELVNWQLSPLDGAG